MPDELAPVDAVLQWLGCAEIERTIRDLRRYGTWLQTEAMAAGALGPHEHDRVWRRHIADSLMFGAKPRAQEQVLDMGTGAGLPGIPLAITFPDWRLVLVDRRERRCDLVERAVALLGLTNVTVRCAEISQVAGEFDRVVMRAVHRTHEAIPLIAKRLAPEGVGLLGISASDAAGGEEPPPGTDMVSIPAGLLDDGVRLLRIAPRGTG